MLLLSSNRNRKMCFKCSQTIPFRHMILFWILFMIYRFINYSTYAENISLKQNKICNVADLSV